MRDMSSSSGPMLIMGDAVALSETGMPDTVAAAMETGESNASSVRGQDEEREESSHVVIAAAEAYVEETRSIARRRARYYRCVVKTCNAMLLGLVVGFAGIFVYAWIDASRKSQYDYTIALITVMFFGTVICALGYRRRLATAMGHLEDDISGLPMQMQVDQIDFFEQWTQPPKGVPQHVRQNFDYFIFSTPADTVPARKLPPSPVPDPCGRAANLVCQGSTTGSDAQASAASGYSVAGSSSKGAMTTPSKRGSATNSFEEDKADSVAGSAAAVPQYQMQQHPPYGLFSWTAPALTDCSVCLEAYRTGDRICRLPCMHAFHAGCIDTWLDQHHVCPQCRLDLLPPESSWDRSSRSSAINAAPFSNLFGSLDQILTVPRPPTFSDSRTTETSPAAATAAAPIAHFAHSPAYGVSPASAYGGVVPFRRSPRVPRPEPSRHGTPSSTSGSPAAAARVHPSHFMSPAYTPSPLSTANSSNLRWSPQFVTMGTRSRGTPVPSGVSLGVFPPLGPHSSPFSGLDAPQQRSGSVGGGNGGGGARSGSRRFLPPTPSRGRGQTTHSSPLIAPQNPPPPQRQQSPHRGSRLDGGSRSHDAMPEVRVIDDGQVQGQSQGQSAMGARAGVRAPSPPPLPRLTPRSQALSCGEIPANPVPAGSPSVFHGAAFDDGDGGRGVTNGNVRNRSGSVGINGCGGVTWGGGRTRSGSGHKHLRMLHLNRRPRSSSCDVVIGSAGSPGLFVLGNVGEFDHLGGTVMTNKGRITRRAATRPTASSEDVEDIRGVRSSASGLTVPFRRRQGSDDSAVGGNLLVRRDALEWAFMSGSSDASDRQGPPTERMRSITGNTVPDSSAQGQEDGEGEEGGGLHQQAEREQQNAHQPEGQPQEALQHRQRSQEQQQQHLIHQGAAPHACLSFDDDDTSGESEGGITTGGEGDDDNLHDEDFEEEELQVEVTIGRMEGHENFWNMFACQ